MRFNILDNDESCKSLTDLQDMLDCEMDLRIGNNLENIIQVNIY